MKTTEEMIKWAIQAHKNTNHKYDEHDYDYHLSQVAMTSMFFMDLIPRKDVSNVFVACFCHDLIEDARMTYNDVLKNTNEVIAEITYALTNEKGKTRKERASDKYYAGILAVPYAPFVKKCDRIANMLYSRQSGSGMYEAYQKELDDFLRRLPTPEYSPMDDFLRKI